MGIIRRRWSKVIEFFNFFMAIYDIHIEIQCDNENKSIAIDIDL